MKAKKKKVTVLWYVMLCILVNSSTFHGITSQKTIFFRNYCLYLCYSLTCSTKFSIFVYLLVTCAVQCVCVVFQ